MRLKRQPFGRISITNSSMEQRTRMIDPGIVNLAPARDPQSQATLQIDVIADLVCPWCYLGKRRLDDALSAVRGPSLVSWYPFQLNPDMPAEGMLMDEYLESRFGGREAVQPGLEYLTEKGRLENVTFRFDLIERVPNTLDAHRLLQLADREGRAALPLAEELMRRFFAEGQDISDRNVLIEAGERHGMERLAVAAALDDEKTRQIVLSQEAQVRKGGVTGVPDFLINKRLFVTGAQSTETLVNVFDRAMFGEESELPVSEVVH